MLINDGILMKRKGKDQSSELVLNVENFMSTMQPSWILKAMLKEISSRRKLMIKEKIASLRLSTIQIYQETYHMEQHTVYIHHM